MLYLTKAILVLGKEEGRYTPVSVVYFTKSATAFSTSGATDTDDAMRYLSSFLLRSVYSPFMLCSVYNFSRTCSPL
ncbi:hypothetical protein ANCCAN_19912 [Ancylostoma caninum]|uniref:Uncharacterized protein n=1 Tax=Ancylostoma caninum TaxID=29170 RepID=A0A368FVE8_ANCCA|nr:hypothetical protein ANCCAN_19912 [Ancylostoma caninum]